VRKLIPTLPVLALALALHAAFAAAGTPTPAFGTALMSPTLLDSAALRLEARGKSRLAEKRAERRHRRRHRGVGHARQAPVVAVPPQLEAIARCESGGDPHAIGGGGAYRGKYQFSYATWAAVGGSGDPAAAPEAEQDRRAAMLYARSGAGQWPVCGS
jgi:Transglycosylase-like domain